MTVPRKPRKKKVVSHLFLIIEEKEDLYTQIHHLNEDIVNTNHAFSQTPKQELAEILQLKGEVFRMKATIWKSKKKTKHALSDSHVKADEQSNLVISNPKLVKRLGLKVRPTGTLANQSLGISVANGDFKELKSWLKFGVEVSGIQREMWEFVTPKENSNVNLLTGSLWLRSVDAKLFIQKEEIHIGNTKKEEAISQIFCSTTLSERTWFQANKKDKDVVDESSEGKDKENDMEEIFL